ncbi:hypothetical protein ACE6H2_025961 [Prunus campanulata]
MAVPLDGSAGYNLIKAYIAENGAPTVFLRMGRIGTLLFLPEDDVICILHNKTNMLMLIKQKEDISFIWYSAKSGQLPIVLHQ